MKKLLLFLALLIFPVSGFAQTSVTGQIMEGLFATRPASCASGDMFFATDTFILYQCGPTNTWSLVAGGQFGYANNSAASGALTLNSVTNFFYDYTLSGNVTSMTVSSVGQLAGTIYGVKFCQPSVGGPYTVAWPGVFNNTTTVFSAASSCTTEMFKLNNSGTWDNVSYNAYYQTVDINGTGKPQEPVLNFAPPITSTDTPGVKTTITVPVFQAAGASHASGLVPDPGASASPVLPLCSNGSFSSACQSAVGSLPNPVLAGSIVGGTAPWLLDLDLAMQGPNPYIDVRTYGVRDITYNVAPSIPGITASCTGTLCSLSSASIFINGDGVTIYGAGATNSTSAPSAPTVTSSVAATETATGYVVNGPAGNSTSYSYKIVWERPGGGITAASSATTITNGAASLGSQSVTLSSCTRTASQTSSCATSSAHGLTVGSMVLLVGTSNEPNFGGFYIVQTVPDNTHFTFTGGLLNSATSTGGTAYWFNCNHVVFPTPPSGVIRGYVYGNKTTGYNLIGVTNPVNSGLSGDTSYLTFDDYGSPMTIQPAVPYWVPLTAPSSATNDNLTTTIASGGGTTSVTLTAAATNSVSNATILFDNAPNIAAAAVGTGYIYFPVPLGGANSFYVTNSYLTLNANVSQAGTLFLGDTIQYSGSWYGNLNPAQENETCPPGCIEYHVPIYTHNANPGFYITNSTSAIRGALFYASGDQYSSVFVAPGTNIPSFTLSDSSFGSVNGNDYSGTALTIWGQTPGAGGSGIRIERTMFETGPSQVNGSTASPSVIFKNMGEIFMSGIMQTRRGVFFEPAQSGIEFHFKQDYEIEGPITPVIAGFNCSNSPGGWVKIENTIIDTSVLPLFSNLGCQSGSLGINLSINGSNTPGGGPLVSGWPIPNLLVSNLSYNTNLGQNVNVTRDVFGSYSDGLTTAAFVQGITNQNKDISIGPNSAAFTEALAPAAPTCSVATATPSSPAGTFTFTYASTYPPNNGWGNMSLASSSCTSNGTNQQITITIPSAVSGATGYVIWAGPNQLTCSAPSTTTLTYTWSAASCNLPLSNFAGAGPTGMYGLNSWAYTSLITGYQQFSPVTAPGGVSGTSQNFFDTSTNWPSFNVSTTKNLYLGIAASSSWSPGQAACFSTGTTGLMVACSGGGGTPGGANLSIQYNNSGAFGGISVPTSPNNAPQFLTSTPSGGGVQAAFLLIGITPRTVTGTSDTILAADRGNQVVYTSGSAVAVNVSAPSVTNFGNFTMRTNVKGAGTVTFTPSAGLINGSATYAQTTGLICVWTTPDNTNYDVTCPGSTSVTTTGSPSSGNITKFSGSSTITNGDLSGDVTTSGTLATTIANAAVNPAKTVASLDRRVCDVAIGDQSSSSAITNSQLGPQKRMCYIPAAATVVEIDVAADGGTPNVIVAKNHAGTVTNLLSGALATAASGGIACSNTGGTTGLDGATTCSATLQNTSVALGDYFELVSGTAGGTAKLMTIHVLYTITGSL